MIKNKVLIFFPFISFHCLVCGSKHCDIAIQICFVNSFCVPQQFLELKMKELFQ